MAKNNLAIGHGDPVHTELASSYTIDGTAYGLPEIVAAAANMKELDTEAWNGLKMADKLAAVKEYVDAVNASPDGGSESSAAPQPPAPPQNDTEDTEVGTGGGESSGTSNEDDTGGEETSETTESEDAPKTAEEILADDDDEPVLPNDDKDDGTEDMEKEIELLKAQNESLRRERDEWRGKAAGFKNKLDERAAADKEAASLHGHTDNLQAPY